MTVRTLAALILRPCLQTGPFFLAKLRSLPAGCAGRGKCNPSLCSPGRTRFKGWDDVTVIREAEVSRVGTLPHPSAGGTAPCASLMERSAKKGEQPSATLQRRHRAAPGVVGDALLLSAGWD